MYGLAKPFSVGDSSIPTLVAMTTRLRLPDRASQLPITVSDSPPLCPGAHFEYTSAVSTRLNPASTNRSRIANEVGSSAVQPKTLPPNANGATLIPELPSGRVFMMLNPGDIQS